MISRSVTLDDVAQLAGVSYQTVSRVLNRSEQVSARTREKVEAAMQQLNYVPNRVAQQLAGKATRTLGLATSNLSLMAPAQIAAAIQQRAASAGYHLVIAMNSGQPVEATINELLAQRVDGLLINMPLQAERAEQIQALCGEKPTLFLDVEPRAAVAQCQFPNEAGARAAVDHLVALGHVQIGLLNGPVDSVAARQREAAWLAALAERQLTPYCLLRGDWSARSGYQAMLNQLPDALPSALLVANDQMALGAMRALHQYGVRIPAEMSLVGYDDTAESAWYQPPLTTVRQDLQRLGEASVEQIVSRLAGSETPALALETKLIVRETTAAPGDESSALPELAQQLQQIARQLMKPSAY
ncbi:LacI family DNA-binding transcriptional regulator [Pantoea sp. LMR881]|uniref:LacI family DNA-binding transcriptional regulator n=1 Tax=Pantoea sp. LMR881 TaxID=3014336 RepID=UPI0022AE72A1|nr:LacI family DNA-binding transcriptional regulator [Pantoea sp. LMR881]MCZ4060778.1 LacI family DNA-binding transcriptional regulator [Pantoea sp. LMR881]